MTTARSGEVSNGGAPPIFWIQPSCAEIVEDEEGERAGFLLWWFVCVHLIPGSHRSGEPCQLPTSCTRKLKGHFAAAHKSQRQGRD
jgi:hypothetical protein